VAQDLICLKIRWVIYETLFCLLEYQIRIKKICFSSRRYSSSKLHVCFYQVFL